MTGCNICDWPEDEIIASNGEAKAFFVKNPARPGHIAVATRAHRPWIPDASPSEAGAVMSLARDVAARAHQAVELEKFYLAAVGDVDRHFHVHLIPKGAGDPRLGPFLFSAAGWQGHEGAARDEALERKILRAVAAAPLHDDVPEIEKVVAALYEAISFEAGQQPDWREMERLFAPGARLTRVAAGIAQPLSLDQFRAEVSAAIEKGLWTSFHEREVGSRIDATGAVAQVESRYRAKPSAQAAEVLGEGVNYIQLARNAGEWKVVSLLWEAWQ